MKKHVIVRGRPVAVKQDGDRTIAEGIEVPRGSLVVQFEPPREIEKQIKPQKVYPFKATLAGEAWIGYGTNPITAVQSLVDCMWADGYADGAISLPDVMRHVREEI